MKKKEEKNEIRTKGKHFFTPRYLHKQSVSMLTDALEMEEGRDCLQEIDTDSWKMFLQMPHLQSAGV